MDDEKDVTIGDFNTSGKHALFTAPRWVKFFEAIEEIDKAVECAATLKPTKYKFHVGSNCYISVSDELPFVDIRRWYQRGSEMTIRPTLGRHFAHVRTVEPAQGGRQAGGYEERVRGRRAMLAHEPTGNGTVLGMHDGSISVNFDCCCC